MKVKKKKQNKYIESEFQVPLAPIPKYFGPDGPGMNTRQQSHNYDNDFKHEQPDDIKYNLPLFDSNLEMENNITNHFINQLVKDGKISIIEAESIRHQTKNMNFLESQNFISSIEYRKND